MAAHPVLAARQPLEEAAFRGAVPATEVEPGAKLAKGPFPAEIVPIADEHGYVVITV